MITPSTLDNNGNASDTAVNGGVSTTIKSATPGPDETSNCTAIAGRRKSASNNNTREPILAPPTIAAVLAGYALGLAWTIIVLVLELPGWRD